MYKVYAHVFPNDKVYVGITSQTLEKRWRNGKGYSRTQPLMRKAINKYGWNNIRHVLLYDNLSKECAEDIEEHFIKDLKLFSTDYGYNTTMGGNANVPTEETKKLMSQKVQEKWEDDSYREKAIHSMKNKKRSPEARKNISKAQRERFKDEEQRRRISEAQKGKKRTEQAKKKTSETLKKFYSVEENRIKHKEDMMIRNQCQCKPVLCIELNRKFESIKDASEWVGLCHQNLSACLQGKRKTYGGYHWKYC